MLGGIDWTSFLPAAVLVSLIPGANQLLSLQNAIRQGTLDATVALTGRFSAFAVMVLGVALGLGALLAKSPAALSAVRWLGVAYLSWLGVLTLWRVWRASAADSRSTVTSSEQHQERRALVCNEFVVAITNPKAVLLFAAFLPQFIRGVDSAPVGQLLVIGFAYICIEAVTAMVYTIGGGYVGTLQLTRRAHRLIDVLTASSFLALAAFLVFD